MQDHYRETSGTNSGSTAHRTEKLRLEKSNDPPVRYVLTLIPESEPAQTATEVRPEVKEFIKEVIVPILVEKYMAKLSQSGSADGNAKTEEADVSDTCLTSSQLAERWSCDAHTLSVVARSQQGKLLRFDMKGRIAVAKVEEFERKYGTSG